MTASRSLSKRISRNKWAINSPVVEALKSPDNFWTDVITLVQSYLFILFAAWNDGLLGLPSNGLTYGVEYLIAIGIVIEIYLRLRFTEQKSWYFYPLLIVDAISVLTIIPALGFVTLARVIRLIVSAVRMLHLIDKMSRVKGNPFTILLVYPLIVPVAAALFYAVEGHDKHAQIHNFFEALVLMLSYSLTVGLASNHPVTYAGKTIAGVMLLIGILCISIIGNALSDRYTILRSSEVEKQGPG